MLQPDFLHDSLVQLTRSSRPLDVLSEYATARGAVHTLLLTINPVVQVVDEWLAEGRPRLGERGRDLLRLTDASLKPLFIPDLGANQHQALTVPLLRGAALLPLKISQYPIGWLICLWAEPYPFSPADQAMLIALTDQAAPVINLMWGLTSVQRKVIELRLAKQESEILRAATQKLSDARITAHVLEAVSEYPRAAGATAAYLTYRVGDESRLVAEWHEPPSITPGQRPSLLDTHIYKAGEELILADDRCADVETSRAVLHLNNRGVWLGSIIFEWAEPYYFNERDHYLYLALLQQVSSVIDSKQLFEQITLRAQRNERLLKVNSALSRATDELQILEAITQYPPIQAAARVVLNYVDLDQQDQVVRSEAVAYYEQGEIAYFTQAMARPPVRLRLASFMYEESEKVILIDNLLTDNRLTAEERDEILEQSPLRALALIPLYSNRRYQGVLAISWYETHHFTAEESDIYEELRRTLPALIATRRAYLKEEKARHDAEQRAHDLETIASMSAAISSILDEATLLNEVARITQRSFPHYSVFIYLLQGDELRRIHSQRSPENSNDQHTYRILVGDERSLMSEAVRTRTSRVISDIHEATGYNLYPLIQGARSEMAIPMIAGNEVIGVVAVQTPLVDHFSEPDIQLVKTLVDLIAVALQNARLYSQAQQLAVAEERNRLARELHDSVSQALFGIVLGANTAQTLLKEQQYTQLTSAVDYVLSLAKAGLEEIRASIFDLRPVVLEDQGLIYAIRGHLNTLQARYHIEVEAELCPEPELPFIVKEALYRIAREALHNIVKHAQATHVQVSLSCDAQQIHMRVEDNGSGFDTSRAYATSLGLKSMRERVAFLGGSLQLHSVPGEGTCITICVPVGLSQV